MVRINENNLAYFSFQIHWILIFILFYFILVWFAGQTAPRQPAVNPDEQMIVHKEEILDPEDNDENQQVVLAGI